MKWTIQQLNKLKHKGITFDETIDVSEIKERDSQIRAISPVHVTGEAVFSGSTISFPLHIEGKMVLPCSRTLADVDYPFDIHSTEIFSLREDLISDTEGDIHPVEGETIDLTPYIMENILLQIPLQIIGNGSKGEAPDAGEGWEIVDESKKKDRIDPRLADLAKFFDK